MTPISTDQAHVEKQTEDALSANIPNAETTKVLTATDAGIALHRAKSAPDLFKQLDL